MTELRRAHSALAESVPSYQPDRPSQAGTQQISEALILRVVTEFQGFARDLLDLAAVNLVRGSGVQAEHEVRLTSAITSNRWVDRGNPHLEAIRKDAERLGVSSLHSQLVAGNPKHDGDTRLLKELIELRNALSHDDQDRLRGLSRRGARATMSYVDAAHACLDRYARALDRVIWDHLSGLFSAVDPWSPL